MATTARGGGRPRPEETADIDRAVEAAALKILIEQGENATMSAIALGAGLSRKSLYARFPNKTELFLTVIRRLLADVRELDFDRSGSVEQQLRNYIETALEIIARPQAQALQRLLTMDTGYLGVLREDMIAASHTLFYGPLRDLLERARRANEIVVADVDATTLAIMRLIFAESMMLASNVPATSPAAYAEFLVDLICRGLNPRI